MARFSLALVLLGFAGALAQGREASPWDAMMSNISDCTAAPPSPSNPVTVVQTLHNSVTATYASAATIKMAYLTDQDGTILAMNSGPLPASKQLTFAWTKADWDADLDDEFHWPGPPSGVVPHLVYDTCEDVAAATVTPTWTGKIAELSQVFDVGGESDPGYFSGEVTPLSGSFTANLAGGTSWLTSDGTFTASFAALGATTGARRIAPLPPPAPPSPTPYAPPTATPAVPPSPPFVNAYWVENQVGDVLNYKEAVYPDTAAKSLNGAFPSGTTALTACRLFDGAKVCSTVNLVDKYVAKMTAVPPTDVGTNCATVGDCATFESKFSAMVNTAKQTRVKAVGCSQYAIYAKNVSDGAIFAFALNSYIQFEATTTALGGNTYEVFVTCDGATVSKGVVDMALVPASTFSYRGPVTIVGAPACNATNGDGVMTTKGHESGKTFQVDGRECNCNNGTLFCGAGPTPDAGMHLSDGEAVGIALSVSFIVILLLMALVFLCLKKTAQKSSSAVLKSNTQEFPNDEAL